MRKKIISLLLFALISTGQAYPFSVAWGLSHEQHLCSCSSIRKVCDCDHAGEHAHGSSTKKFSCHEARESSYKSTPCGQEKSHDDILSFKTDPFLKTDAPSMVVSSKIDYRHFFKEKLSSVFSIPDSPPPKA